MEKIWLKSYPKGMPETHPTPPYGSLVDMFTRSISKYADNTAFECSGRSMTYKEVGQHAENLAAYFQNNLNAKKGDTIALMTPNDLAFPITVIAAHMCGMIVVNVNPLYTARELEHQLNDAKVKSLVVFGPVSGTYASIQDKVAVENVIVIGGEDFNVDAPTQPDLTEISVNKIWFLDALNEGATSSFTSVEVTLSDLAFLQYTGGTTGPSKGAMLSHKNIVHNLMQIFTWWNARLDEEDELMVTALPLYHIFALQANFLTFFNIGGNNILIPNPRDIDSFMKALEGKSITAINGVNTIFAGLPLVPAFQKLDFSRLDFCIGGGTPIIPTTADAWKALTGATICQAYGLSEASPIVTGNIIESSTFKSSIGLPPPGTELKILDDDENEMPIGESGELCARGPQIMEGYWQREDATKDAMTKDGFLKTGDIAIIDEDGYVHIVDRKKDMVLVSGFNVFPNEIESILTAHPDVMEVACIGVPDDKSGEAVKVFIVPTVGVDPSKDSILEFCRENLTAYKVPKHIDFITELPKSTVGKILRRELRDQEMAKLK